jgi:hypothetical protein
MQNLPSGAQALHPSRQEALQQNTPSGMIHPAGRDENPQQTSGAECGDISTRVVQNPGR